MSIGNAHYEKVFFPKFKKCMEDMLRLFFQYTVIPRKIMKIEKMKLEENASRNEWNEGTKK